MIRAKINIRVPKLAIVKFEGDFNQHVFDVMKESAAAFLTAALNAVQGAPHTSGDSFPVQTGEAKASLSRLAELVDYNLTIVPAPKRKSRVAEGRSQGDAFLGKTSKFRYRFSVSINVPHYEMFERHAIGPPPTSDTPWRTLNAGSVAFERTFNQYFGRGFDLQQYFI